jgi:hypothetical protein
MKQPFGAQLEAAREGDMFKWIADHRVGMVLQVDCY